MPATFGAISLRGIEVAMPVASAPDGDVFHACVAQVLCHRLPASGAVAMNNLGTNIAAGTGQLIQFCGAMLLYLPPYSPDLNPMEEASSKFKQCLSAAKIPAAEALSRPLPKLSKPSLQATVLPGSAYRSPLKTSRNGLSRCATSSRYNAYPLRSGEFESLPAFGAP